MHYYDINSRERYMKKNKKFVWAGRAPCGLAQTENVCGHITAGVTGYHDNIIRRAREIFLILFLITPLAQNFPSKSTIKKYYLLGGHEFSTSRSLEMIGKISLVMWLHLNQSYSKNLSMWEINKFNNVARFPHLIFLEDRKFPCGW